MKIIIKTHKRKGGWCGSWWGVRLCGVDFPKRGIATSRQDFNSFRTCVEDWIRKEYQTEFKVPHTFIQNMRLKDIRNNKNAKSYLIYKLCLS